MPAGEKNGMAKLTNENVNEIRKLHKLGYKAFSLAKAFGVSQSNISMILHGHRWGRVKEDSNIERGK